MSDEALYDSFQEANRAMDYVQRFWTQYEYATLTGETFVPHQIPPRGNWERICVREESPGCWYILRIHCNGNTGTEQILERLYVRDINTKVKL